jgi:hypothetical protein
MAIKGFFLVWTILGHFKVTIKYNKRQKIVFKKFRKGIKNAEFYAEFKSVQKIINKKVRKNGILPILSLIEKVFSL